jgi:diguanylate cyclase (GGDEF)-like protein
MRINRPAASAASFFRDMTAQHDPLTNLADRALFAERWASGLLNGRQRNSTHAPSIIGDGGGHASRSDDVDPARQAQPDLAAVNELILHNARMATALDHMSQGLCMFDVDKKLIVCNAQYTRMYGIPPEDVQPGTPFRQILQNRLDNGQFTVGNPLDYIAERMAAVAEGKASVKVHHLTDGRLIAISHCPLEDGGWVATHDDITDIRRIEAQVAHMAHHDALTDLPNRVLFRDELGRALERIRPGEHLAVLCLDLDQFKSVNDTLGHPVGDVLLREVAHRLRKGTRGRDLVARIDGDAFAILQGAIKGPESAKALAEHIVNSLRQPYEVDGHQVVIGTSIGIAVAPTDSGDADQLLKLADMALYRCKLEGRGMYRFFEPEMDARMQARRALELDLRKALVNGELEIHYQPIVNIQTDRVSGFEALLRWTHAERGSVPPSEFIPLAEDIGLIGQVGAWVLKKACAEAAKWPADVQLAVNLSPAQFRGRALVLDVLAALEHSGLPANRLELEITETVMLQATGPTLATLHSLRELGVHISLDDFGTGCSSLSHLHEFPFDTASAVRGADGHRAHRRSGRAARAQRQDHGARRPHPVCGQRVELGVLDVVDAGLGEIVMMDDERQAIGCPFRRRRGAHQLAFADRIGERIVERHQDDGLVLEVLGGVVGEAGAHGIVSLLGVRVLPVVAPAGVDVDHVARQDAAPAEALRLDHRLDIGGRDQLSGAQRLAAAEMALASSSTALVTIGGACSMPSICSGESGEGLT